MKALHSATFILTVVGALNWGLVGLFNYNLVHSLLGSFGVEQLVYILVGLSAVVIILTHKTTCKYCGAK